MSQLTTELKKLIEGYRKIIIKNDCDKESFEVIASDFPNLVNEENEAMVREYIKEIK